MKQVIHIFGASGSGTTTLGKTVSEKIGFRLLDSDDYLWLPTDPKFTEKRSLEERLLLMQQDLNGCCGAVITGSLVNWGDALIPQFTLAVRLITPTAVRLERLKKREYARFGARILPGGDMFEAHQSFLDWASRYDTADTSMRSAAMHDLWQKKLLCPRLDLDGTLPLDVLAETVLKAL